MYNILYILIRNFGSSRVSDLIVEAPFAQPKELILRKAQAQSGRLPPASPKARGLSTQSQAVDTAHHNIAGIPAL